MKLNLITLDGTKYSEDAYSVELPTADGRIGVFQDHEPLLGVVVPGVITVKRKATDGPRDWEEYATYGGVLEVTGKQVQVLVDEADHGDDINEAEAEKARQAAKTMLKNAGTQVELERAQSLIDRQTVRLQVAGLRRRHRQR